MRLQEHPNKSGMQAGGQGRSFRAPRRSKAAGTGAKNKIDCIIVKDLSRFGRNSIKTGYFIERVFPSYHTRFISVSDDFDTNHFMGGTGGIDVAFKCLISERYSRDMSAKAKTAKYAKMRRDAYQSKICPYGYKKSAAEITRRLYSRNMPTPGEYKAGKGKKMYDTSRTHGIWHSSTILRIVDSESKLGQGIEEYMLFYNGSRPHSSLQYKCSDKRGEMFNNDGIAGRI